jgi:hypothetical protein
LPRTHYVAQAGLELILLPQPPECWDYKHVPPSTAQYFWKLIYFIHCFKLYAYMIFKYINTLWYITNKHIMLILLSLTFYKHRHRGSEVKY